MIVSSRPKTEKEMEDIRKKAAADGMSVIELKDGSFITYGKEGKRLIVTNRITLTY